MSQDSMSPDLIQMLKDRMLQTKVSHDQVVETQKHLGGEIFTPTQHVKKSRAPGASVLCHKPNYELLLKELVHMLKAKKAVINKQIDIFTVGLTVLHDLLLQMTQFGLKLSTDAIIEYLLANHASLLPLEKDWQDMLNEKLHQFENIKGSDKKSVSFQEEAKPIIDQIQILFLSHGTEKINIGDILLLSLIIFQEMFHQISAVHPNAPLNHQSFTNFLNRIPGNLEKSVTEK